MFCCLQVINNKEDAGWGPNAVFRCASRPLHATVPPKPCRLALPSPARRAARPADSTAVAIAPPRPALQVPRPAGRRVRATIANCRVHCGSPLGRARLPGRFPLEGGTGGIWKKVAKLLPPERQRYGCQLVGLDKDRQVATFADGRQVSS